MYGGKVVEQATTATLFRDPRHRYTEALFESMPTLEQDRAASLRTISGTPPRLIGLAAACRFAPRCRVRRRGLHHPGPGAAHRRTGARPRLPASQGAGTRPRRPPGPALAGAAAGRGRPAGDDGPPLLQLDNVVKQFSLRSTAPLARGRVVHAVSGVTLSVRAGETFGIVGESGCGKTTLGRMIVGLEQPTSGSVVFDGQDLGAQRGREFRRRRRDLQLMFQDSAAALDPRMPVSALIAEPLAAQGIGTGRERRAAVAELLDAVGLPREAARRYPHEFSGGQRQRIAMARALALRPRVIVADEPVSALDVSVQAQILNLMRSLQDRYQLTYVVISHDLSLLKYLADRVGVMYLGTLVETGTSEEVYRAPRHPYTAGLIQAIPLPDPAAERAKTASGLGGELPSAVNPPSGCRFRTRCPRASAVCEREAPVLAASAGLSAVACHHPLTSPAAARPARRVTARRPVPN